MPKPPRNRPKLNHTILAAKLALVRQTTILRFHKEPQFKNDGKYSGRGDVPNEWAVAYGRIVTVSNLGKEDGGFIGAPVGMIVEPYNFHILKWVIDTPEPELR